MNDRDLLHCHAESCSNTYAIEDSDARTATRFCSADCEADAAGTGPHAQRLHPDAPPAPPGLRPRVGVEYGCGEATCAGCYEPVVPSSPAPTVTIPEALYQRLLAVAEDAQCVLECNCSLVDDSCAGTCTHSMAARALDEAKTHATPAAR